ncbi:FAD/NAD(P)-binding oxidoreductase family protein [Euphorbia peplus]|nr:FAD/NAD(P)-binding oxidoreductase family protein [Euphorbia peplus]
MDVVDEIVIVGAGISGLATAVALHKKGIRSKVIEKSHDLTTYGAAIILTPHAWLLLHHLGVASLLHHTCIPIQYGDCISLDDCTRTKLIGRGEIHCVKRIDLIKALADSLPNDTIHYGRHVVSVQMDQLTTYLILHLDNGSVMKAKVVIGCDGVNSRIGKYIGLNPPKFYPICVVRGLSYYHNGHDFGAHFNMMKKSNVQLGIIPVNHHFVYWFATRHWSSNDSRISRNQNHIKESTIKALGGFPKREIELVKKSKEESLHVTGVKYRAPWEFLMAKFKKGRVTVAGDAMHVMGPFLAQGGSASIEDAMVLATCLAQNLHSNNCMIEQAIDEYLYQRKIKLFWLTLHSYLIGTTLHSSFMVKIFSIVLLFTLFRNS